MISRYRLAVIPGDGVGGEVTSVAMAVLERVAALTGSFSVEAVTFPWSCQWYLKHGQMMPADALDRLSDFDALLLGAVGFPGVPDHVSLRGLLLPIRQSFDQYVNLRPIQIWPGMKSPLRCADSDTVDILCIRENSEGEYVGVGGRYRSPDAGEIAIQTSIFTERAVERIVRYACDRALERRGKLASATKSNALQYTAVLWDEVVVRGPESYPDVIVTPYHVDALAARFVTSPESLDVVVGSNLFGDILTDLGAALQGSLGLAASGNLNPERRYPSMFEPVHGSAPDIAGRGIANPVGAIWSVALLLEHLGEHESNGLVLRSLKRTVANGPRTPDLGGAATTDEVMRSVLDEMDADERLHVAP